MDLYPAIASKDRRFDGRFWVGVTTTGIYCRPSCPARTPKPENVRFFPSVAAAAKAGFRACRRCAPDAVPGSPQWDARADLTARAVRLINDGVMDRGGVPALAARLGYTERHLHRLLTDELGAGPLALARTQRAQTAKTLIAKTAMTLTEIAFAAGFGSVRQFNDTFREVYGTVPSSLRRGVDDVNGTIALRLSYRPPLSTDMLFEFLGARAIPSIESYVDGVYTRALRLPHGPGSVTLRPGEGYIAAGLQLTDIRDLTPAVARCRRLLDLDADPAAIDDALAADPALVSLIDKHPGVRLPRAVDGFEAAVRAVVGQQISVAGARTVLSRITAAAHSPGMGRPDFGVIRPSAGSDGRTSPRSGAPTFGDDSPKFGFPTPEELLAVPDEVFSMPVRRRETLRALARAMCDGLTLDSGSDRAATREALLDLPGVGPWTADYIAMRALGDPDVLLPTDLGTLRGAAALGLPTDPKQLAEHAEIWRPWRSYAQIRLWSAA